MADFEERLQETTTVVFAFATCVNEMFGDIPRYEFGHLLGSLGVSYVLFRCPRDMWYQHGVEGIGGVGDVARYIRTVSDHYPRSVALGTSSGSYAALLFGQLAPTLEAVAISPVTGVGDDVMGDFSPEWHHRLVHDHSRVRIRDLKEVYEGGPRTIVRMFVTDGEAAEIDHKMATRLNAGDITLVPGYTHAGLARGMRDRGMLADLLR